MKTPNSFLGLDVGGTNLKAMAFSPDGGVLLEKNVPTGDDQSSAWLDRARALASEVAAAVPGPSRVGIAAPGLTARDGKSIAFMPGRLAGLENLNWREWLGVESSVQVFNDAKAALLGEVWRGAARDATNVILLTLGTGVGGAAMVDGNLLHGNLGRAGHLGHVSLNPDGARDIVNTPGSLEDAIGECTVAARSGGRFQTTQELVAAFLGGVPEAKTVWLRSIRALAAAIASLVNVLDPEIVVIGGGIAEAGDALFHPLEMELQNLEWRPGGAKVRVAKAALGRDAGATGAAYGTRLQSETNSKTNPTT